MDAWFSAHHAAHHGHGELIGGRLVSGFELPVRADSVRSAFIDAQLGAVHAPADTGLAPVLAVHDARYVDFLQGAWARWAALGHTHPALGMVWHAGLGLPQTEPRHIEGALGCASAIVAHGGGGGGYCCCCPSFGVQGQGLASTRPGATWNGH